MRPVGRVSAQNGPRSDTDRRWRAIRLGRGAPCRRPPGRAPPRFASAPRGTPPTSRLDLAVRSAIEFAHAGDGHVRPEDPPPVDSAPSIEPPAPTVSGVWLTAGRVREPITKLLLELLAPNQPNPGLREALVEELGRPVKKLGVVLDYLGLRRAGPGIEGTATRAGSAEGRARPLARGTRHAGGRLSARSGVGDERSRPGGARPRGLRPPWRGRAAPRPALCGLASRATRMGRPSAGSSVRSRPSLRCWHGLADTCKSWIPSVLWSADGTVRVQFGSPAQTTRNLLREGVERAPVRAAGHLCRGPHELR